jgi:hypothetical protein
MFHGDVSLLAMSYELLSHPGNILQKFQTTTPPPPSRGREFKGLTLVRYTWDITLMSYEQKTLSSKPKAQSSSPFTPAGQRKDLVPHPVVLIIYHRTATIILWKLTIGEQ